MKVEMEARNHLQLEKIVYEYTVVYMIDDKKAFFKAKEDKNSRSSSQSAELYWWCNFFIICTWRKMMIALIG